MPSKTPPIVYNLFPRLAGKMTEWPVFFDAAREMAFNWIFLNPINEAGFSGSLYAVKDYYRFNPLFVEENADHEAQVKAMLAAAGQRGLKVMLDLVINHTAKDARLVGEHRDWYKREENGDIKSPWCMDGDQKIVWGDLAELDHEGPKRDEIAAYFEGVIEYYLRLGFKGFRCDAAYKLPPELWKRLIVKARTIDPEARFFAETLGCTIDQTVNTARAGFDYIFNSSKWWDYKEGWCLDQLEKTRRVVPSIGFPESHDTRRLMKELDGSAPAVKQRYLFECLFSTGVMIVCGFESGWQRRVDVCLTNPRHQEPVNIDLKPFIERCNRIKLDHPVFAEDCEMKIIEAREEPLRVLLKKSATGQKGLIVINTCFKHGYTYSVESLKKLMETEDRIIDVSPEYGIPELADRFEYGLRPGQVIALATVAR